MAKHGRHERKQDGPLVAALAAGLSVRAAAQRAGVGETTAYRRLRDPAFRETVDRAKREIISRATARLAAGTTKAADTLRRLLDSGDERVQLAAARWILRLTTHLREHAEMEARIRNLETILKEQGK